MTNSGPVVYVALPAMDELENLPAFMDCIRRQTYSRLRVFVCVNQPDAWWGRVDKLPICQNNMLSLTYLQGIRDVEMTVIDRCSKGAGWADKKAGVGWARKVVMDAIAEVAAPEDVLVSLDADTTFGPQYLATLVEAICDNPKASAVSVPYYHRLTGDQEKDRAILRYEIYMRHYANNLWRINSPYAFTAIGSAIALPFRAYKAVGGITPHKSGEDFYFLMKLRKYGPVLTWVSEKVYPAARYSDRVGFGTGPAMIKGRSGDWDSYPVYPAAFFDEVRWTMDLFPELFRQDLKTSWDDFLEDKFGTDSIWKPLRDNSKTREQFVRACHNKLDAFRVLQFLKWRITGSEPDDEGHLFDCLEHHYNDQLPGLSYNRDGFSLASSPVGQLDELRNLLAAIEQDYQRKHLLTPPF